MRLALVSKSREIGFWGPPGGSWGGPWEPMSPPGGHGLPSGGASRGKNLAFVLVKHQFLKYHLIALRGGSGALRLACSGLLGPFLDFLAASKFFGASPGVPSGGVQKPFWGVFWVLFFS